MFSWLGRVFGTEKALGSVIDSVSSGLDKLHFGDQEKAEFNIKMSDRVLQWVEQSSGQNQARRFLAVSISMTWLSMYIYSMLMGLLSPWVVIWVDNTDKATKVTEAMQLSAQSVGESAGGMTGAMMLILGFYFAAPHLGSIVGPAMERFSKVKVGK